ncbi:hypothetical protein DOTSEDRAFT_83383 [Dothistroma septosporum NZE10]|uniref:RRM domain-containing protein n=1 Tax=Dothistroma septosporum (strain NZE10 / CBS 128990) TaxID=675120 RepID=M2XZX0_DOTSN|nr:hypothetical protein DOTSEDRAFT_83383 [Dothistroma septosporum NZE10]
MAPAIVDLQDICSDHGALAYGAKLVHGVQVVVTVLRLEEMDASALEGRAPLGMVAEREGLKLHHCDKTTWENGHKLNITSPVYFIARALSREAAAASHIHVVWSACQRSCHIACWGKAVPSFFSSHLQLRVQGSRHGLLPALIPGRMAPASTFSSSPLVQNLSAQTSNIVHCTSSATELTGIRFALHPHHSFATHRCHLLTIATMSASTTIAGGQPAKQSVASNDSLMENMPGQVGVNIPPSPPLSESSVGIRIDDMAAHSKLTTREILLADEAKRGPPTPPAEQDLSAAPIHSINEPVKPVTTAPMSTPPTVDKQTQIRTYMGAYQAMVKPPQEGAPLNGRIPPPPFGFANVRFKPKKVNLPRFETFHGYESRLRAERIHQAMLKLAEVEQEMTLANSTPAKKNPFGPTKSKELDSGIVALETPNSLASVEPKVSRPFRTSSAPGSICYLPDYSPIHWSSPRPLSSGVPSHLTRAHDAVALARMKYSFEASQKINPGDAAVFVGNLPAGLTDLQLSHELIYAFSKFGYLNVQVSRHYTAEAVKPTAILQFPHREAATKAISNSRGWYIGGRKLRVDRSNAARHLTVWRDGVPHRSPGMPNFAWTSLVDIEIEEIERQFRQYGPFDHVGYVFTDWTFRSRPQNDGIRITFTNYGQFIAAKKALQAGQLPYKEKRAYRGRFLF